MTFPQLELPPRQHDRVRAAVVNHAAQPARRTRFVVPIAAVAATAAIVSGGVVADRWDSSPAPARPAPKVAPVTDGHKGQCNEIRPGRRSDAKGLTVVMDVPKGWTAKAEINLVRYCAQPRPSVGYHHPAGKGFQVYRGFSTRLADLTRDVPIGDPSRDLTPLGQDDLVEAKKVPFTPVAVNGAPARLIRRNTLAWQIDGQWWTVITGSLGSQELQDVAAGLVVFRGTPSWPGAKNAGFEPDTPEPQLAVLPEGSWQPEWTLCLMRTPGTCAIFFRAARWEWWSPTGNFQMPQERKLTDGHGGSSVGGGWTTPKGVVWRHSYGPDRATYRKAAGSSHAVALDSQMVTRLLQAGRR